MSPPSRRIAILTLAVVLAAGWAVRFHAVNTELELPEIQVFRSGEEVPVGKDFFDYADEDMDGYTITVLGAELSPVQDFLEKYDSTEKRELLGHFTDYVYEVRISVANRYNPHVNQKGISLLRYVLQGTDYVLTLDGDCFMMANPDMPGTAFSIRRETTMDMTLTFGVLSRVTSLRHLAEDPPKLQITQYPHQKMIALS